MHGSFLHDDYSLKSRDRFLKNRLTITQESAYISIKFLNFWSISHCFRKRFSKARGGGGQGGFKPPPPPPPLFLKVRESYWDKVFSALPLWVTSQPSRPVSKVAPRSLCSNTDRLRIAYGSLTDRLRFAYGSLTDRLRITNGSLTDH